MPVTPDLSLPYPADSDPVDIPGDMQALAEQIEAVRGAADGLASLDGDGLVPVAQIPEIDAGAMVKLQEIVRATDGTIDFTSIDSGYEHLRIVAFLRSAQSNAEEAFRIRFNNDSSTVCQGGQGGVLNSSFSGGNDVAGTYVMCGFVIGNSGSASRFSAMTIDIPAYTEAFHKSVVTQFHSISGTGAGVVRVGVGGGVWPVTTAINQILLWTGSGAGQFLTGSRATLYGLT